MKRKIAKIPGLVLVLAASMLFSAAPVSAGTLSWSTETVPSTTGNVLRADSDVADFAVAGDGTTIYAVTGEVSLFASGAGTASWSDDFAKVGNYSAKLQGDTGEQIGDDFAAVVIPIDVTLKLSEVTSFVYNYYFLSAGDYGPHMCFYTHDPVDGETAEITLEPSLSPLLPVTATTWHTPTIVPTTDYFFWYGTETNAGGIAPGTGTFNTLGTFQTTADFNRHVIDRIRIEYGWWAPGAPWADEYVYVDDVSLNGRSYSMELGAILKSTDAGVSWSTITNPTGADTAQLVAVAPDDTDIAAIVADDNEVYVTTNGGTSWDDLGTPEDPSTTPAGAAATYLYDIAISAESAGKNYIAVAGIESSLFVLPMVANVWYFDVGAAAPKWVETNSLSGWTSEDDGTEINWTKAVAFSPNFPSDQIMVALTAELNTATTATDSVMFEMFSMNQKLWNEDAGFSDYPVTITSDEGIAGIPSASISLAPDYLGSDDAMRIAFVGLTVAGDTDAVTESGIWRLKDTSKKALKDGVNIHSVGYDGTNLVAGATDDTKVYCSDNPLATDPDFSTASSLKRPSGDIRVVVAWAGTDVVAGTIGNESAFAVSRNNGKSFNDISIIDTALTNLEDVAVSADGSKVYLATDNNTDLSLWRKASSWERVLSVQGDVGTGFIIRLAPDDADVVYVAKKNAKTIYFTQEGGDTKWFTRTAKYSIQDLAVESVDVAYAAVYGATTVSKTTNSGFTWGTAKDTEITDGNIHMIRSLSEDKVIVGSTQGYVAWSSDGNDSWDRINTKLDTAGPVHVIASGLSDGDYIYAAVNTTGTLVQRWEIGQSGTSWKDLSSPSSASTTNQEATGIALMDGVLYVQTVNTTGSYTYRTLSPDSAEPSTSMWSIMYEDAQQFNATPHSLKVSSGSVKLWAVDKATPYLYSFLDELTQAGPTLTGPRDGTLVEINPVSGVAYDVAFTWARPSKAKIYDLKIALDKGFTEVLGASKSTASTTDAEIALVIEGRNFMPETTYYWRVRVNIDGPVKSAYSETRTFTIGELPEAFAPVVIQQPPAPVISVPPAPAITITPPEIVLPPAPAPPPDIIFPSPPAAPAPITPAYIWAIVIIGAILVIALVVLIIRTRRPV